MSVKLAKNQVNLYLIVIHLEHIYYRTLCCLHILADIGTMKYMSFVNIFLDYAHVSSIHIGWHWFTMPSFKVSLTHSLVAHYCSNRRYNIAQMSTCRA